MPNAEPLSEVVDAPFARWNGLLVEEYRRRFANLSGRQTSEFEGSVLRAQEFEQLDAQSRNDLRVSNSYLRTGTVGLVSGSFLTFGSYEMIRAVIAEGHTSFGAIAQTWGYAILGTGSGTVAATSIFILIGHGFMRRRIGSISEENQQHVDRAIDAIQEPQADFEQSVETLIDEIESSNFATEALKSRPFLDLITPCLTHSNTASIVFDHLGLSRKGERLNIWDSPDADAFVELVIAHEAARAEGEPYKSPFCTWLRFNAAVIQVDRMTVVDSRFKDPSTLHDRLTKLSGGVTGLTSTTA